MKLSRARLRAPGPPAPAPLAYAGASALALLAVAGAWAAWAWTKPLPTFGDDSAAGLPPAVTISDPRDDVERRAARIAALNTDNLFDDERAFWRAPRTTADADADAPAGDADRDDPELPITLGPRPGGTRAVTDDGDVRLTAEEDLPDDVKKARANLELFGMYRDRAGTPVAMIGYVQSTRRGRSEPRRPGDAFTDSAHAKAPWAVARVDTDLHRVILVRSGATIALELFPKSAAAKPAPQNGPRSGAEPYTPGEGTPTLQPRSRDEIVAELRAEGVSETDILAVLDLMEIPTGDDAPPVDVVNATPEAKPELDEEAVNKATSEAPGGLEELMRFMAEGRNRARNQDDKDTDQNED